MKTDELLLPHAPFADRCSLFRATCTGAVRLGSLSTKLNQTHFQGQATRLTRDPVVQRGLFDGDTREKQDALDKVVDAIRGRFGTEAVRRGSLLKPENGSNDKTAE